MWYCHHNWTNFNIILTLQQAPAEAEAELAYLNRILAIDLVLTSDSDVFLFGTTHVIRRSLFYYHLHVYLSRHTIGNKYPRNRLIRSLSRSHFAS